MAEWSNAAVLKTVDCNRSGGSNPSFSAKAIRNISCGFFYAQDFLKLVLRKSWVKKSSKPRRGVEDCMFAQDYFIGINAVNPIILFSQVDGNKKPIERSSKRVLCLLRITLLGLTQLIPLSCFHKWMEIKNQSNVVRRGFYACSG